MSSWEDFLGLFGASRWAQAGAILAAFLVVAFVVDFLVAHGLSRLTRRTKSDVDDQVIAILRRPIRSSLLLVGLALATLRIDPSEHFEVGAINPTGLLLNLLATLTVLLWMVAGIRMAAVLVEAASRREKFAGGRAAPLVRNLANLVLVGAGVYFFFLVWGIDVTAWLASAGIIGIAVGFAAKDTLANLFSGFFILTDAPYSLGDYIRLDSGERGQVTHVGIRSTRLLTRDDVEVTIPNALMGNAKIVNESGGRWSKLRLRIPVGVAYGTDVDLVRRILEEVGAAEPDVCHDPEPRARFRAFGESGLDFELLAWIDDPADRGRLLDLLNTAIYKRFATEGVEIPFPKRDVYIKELPTSLAVLAADAEPKD